MKNGKSNIFVIICFFIGLSLVLYPTIVDEYVEKVNELNDDEYNDIINTIKVYNKYLFELTENDILTFDKKTAVLEKLEVLKGNIGYIEIPKIKTVAPIYYGTSEEVLQISIGLLEGSSFPTGEESTHTVLAGHRGLPSSKLFTDVDKLEIGDIFYISVLKQKTAYEVDQIEVVKPEETDLLRIQEGETYATLVTCTPYMINTHRLLVRGKKIEIEEDGEARKIEEKEIKDNIWKKVIAIIILIIIIVITILI